MKPRTRCFKKKTVTTKVVSWSKCLVERKKLRFLSQTKGLVLLFLKRIWYNFLPVLLAVHLECWWKEKDRKHQKMFSCFRRCPQTFSHGLHRLDGVQFYWRQKFSLLCCFSSKLNYGNIIATSQCLIHQSHSNLNFWPPLKFFFGAFILTREARAVGIYPLHLSVSFDLFWCLEGPRTAKTHF